MKADKNSVGVKTIIITPLTSQNKQPSHHQHKSILDFMAELEQETPALKEEFAQGRAWVADTYYADEGDTVRTRRLRLGWSQTELAEKLGTSQPHVARLETQPTDKITLGLCRRLCAVFKIDMNTLNTLLQHQNAVLADGGKL